MMIIKFSFIIIAFYLVSRKIDFVKVVDSISELNLFYFIISILFSSASLIVSAMRSRYYFHEYGLHLRKRFAVIIYYAGYLFNIILPGGIGGDGLKIYYLYKLEKFSKLRSMQIILNERVNGFYALIVLGFIMFYWTAFAEVIPYSTLLNTILLILVTPVYLFGVKYVMRDQIPFAINAAAYSFVVQILQVCSALCLIFAFDSLYLDFTGIINYLFLFIVASIAVIVPVTIGGIGMRELIFLYGIQLINETNIEAAVAFAFLNFVVYVFTCLPAIPLIYKLNLVPRTGANKIKRWL